VVQVPVRQNDIVKIEQVYAHRVRVAARDIAETAIKEDLDTVVLHIQAEAWFSLEVPIDKRVVVQQNRYLHGFEVGWRVETATTMFS
jgi:hypothetical protein